MRVRVAMPPTGFGERLNRMHAWLDDNRGADGWEITPAGRSIINDAISRKTLGCSRARRRAPFT